MLSDLRSAFRQLSKAPGFTATIVVTLALGIGACVTMFNVIDTQLLHTYMPADERPIWIRSVREPGGKVVGGSPADFPRMAAAQHNLRGPRRPSDPIRPRVLRQTVLQKPHAHDKRAPPKA